MSVQSVLFVHLTFLYGPPPHALGSLCGAGSPCTHPQALRPAPGGVYAELVAPALTDAGAPREHGKAMLGTQGDFPDAGKSPKARQGLPPLDPAIAKFPPSLVLRCACTRAASCHNKRPICHFKLAGKSVFYFSPSLTGVTLPAVNPWRGRGIPGDA